MIHTHPLTPPHQMHWMGAAEILSDAVLGRCSDALDLDGQASELLWFAVLNLGNRVAASSYTDCALGRRSTPSPGDRRVYCQAEGLTYPAIVEAIRRGRTFATNGGPLFPFVTIDGKGPGETLEPGGNRPHPLRAEIHCLYPLKSAQLYRRGELAESFSVSGKRGEVVLETTLRDQPGGGAWYVLRVEDERGHWAITSPIYVAPAPASARPFASSLILEISNATRYIELRRAFFAHLIVTVSTGDRLKSVALLKDGQPVRLFTPEMGESRTDGKVPTTGMPGEYGPGWSWASGLSHFQADWPVKETGWYGLRAATAKGKTLVSDELFFDMSRGSSRAADRGPLGRAGYAVGAPGLRRGDAALGDPDALQRRPLVVPEPILLAGPGRVRTRAARACRGRERRIGGPVPDAAPRCERGPRKVIVAREA